MSGSSPGVDRSSTDPHSLSPNPFASRNHRGRWREPPRLRLLRALRGEGALIWSGGAIPAAYELDIFGRGEDRQASGQLTGDFSALPDFSIRPGDRRLRLDDGREIAIDLVSQETATFGFDAKSGPGLIALLAAPPQA